jgi:hypothetical protein
MAQYFKAALTLFKEGYLTSMAPMLPMLLKLKGKPYSLHNHFTMIPAFDLRIPKNFILKAARQVSKSTVLAALKCLRSASIPFFSSLYISPRFEQTRRFSNNYVKPFLVDSYIGRTLIDKSKEQSVMQRNFTNGSMQHFSFAFLDAERVRGISAEEVSYDEVQDIDASFIPIIDEVMSASDYAARLFAGTPKTMDNTLQLLWEDSSMAEWVTKCPACNHQNIASVDHDLLNMIQRPGPSCSKCGGLINPATGTYVHRFPDKSAEFPGLHIPQPVMPMHYLPNPMTGDRDKWRALCNDKENMAKATFLNEKLGESCDVRVSLLTKSILINQSTLTHRNTLEEAKALADKYIDRTLGIDWGGGGLSGISHTVAVVLGHLPNGNIDVLYMERLVDYAEPAAEIAAIMKLMRIFHCTHIAHDFNGSGAVKEVLLLQAGIGPNRIFPAVYQMATSKNMVTYTPPSQTRGGRSYYVVDKARSLALMCELIKHGLYRFPKFETWEKLSTDLLALVEEKREMARGSDIYLITKKASVPDDLSHAINYASLCYWHANQRYPDLAQKIGISLTPQQEAELKGLPKV